jgi:hypothetical protein
MHLKPELTFEEVQRLAQNLGISLRQTMLQPTQPVAKPKLPPGVKTLLTRPNYVHTVETTSGDQVDHTAQEQEASLHYVEVALAHAHLAQAHTRADSSSITQRPSWQSTSWSPSPIFASIRTRGWIIPGGSVMSEPLNRHRYTGPPLVGDTLSVLCLLCYTQEHILADCPRLPTSLQREAKENREAWQLDNPLTDTRPGSPARTVTARSIPSHPARPIARNGRRPRVRPSTMLRLRSVINYLQMRSYCPRRRKTSREETRDGFPSPSRTW